MSEFFTLAGMLSAVNADDSVKAEIGRILDALPSERHFSFYEYCEKYKLAPWIYSQLRNYSLLDKLEPSAAEAFKDSHEKINDRNSRRNNVATKVMNAFRRNGIRVAILKGNYFAHTVYHEVGYKRMNDFDILVDKEDWGRIQDIYSELGFIPLGFGWSGEKEKPASYSHVGMSFISEDFSCIMGTQWGLKSPTTRHRVNMEDLWKTCVPFDFLGQQVLTLSPEYHLLHLILHLEVYKCGIRDCMDLYDLQRTMPVDEAKMLEVIRDSRACSKARFALTMSDLCYETFGKSFVQKIRGVDDRFVERRRISRLKMFRKHHDLHLSYNDYFHSVEKQAIYFNLYPQFHVKLKIYLKILRMIWFPDVDAIHKLNDRTGSVNPLDFFYQWIKSTLIIRALIAQEIGWLFTILLLMKLPVDLILSLRNYFMKKQSYFDYLVGRGIDPQKIKKAVNEIQ